jgi:hypothetical protein
MSCTCFPYLFRLLSYKCSRQNSRRKELVHRDQDIHDAKQDLAREYLGLDFRYSRYMFGANNDVDLAAGSELVVHWY